MGLSAWPKKILRCAQDDVLGGAAALSHVASVTDATRFLVRSE
jgi:hypothetical protein